MNLYGAGGAPCLREAARPRDQAKLCTRLRPVTTTRAVRPCQNTQNPLEATDTETVASQKARFEEMKKTCNALRAPPTPLSRPRQQRGKYTASVTVDQRAALAGQLLLSRPPRPIANPYKS